MWSLDLLLGNPSACVLDVFILDALSKKSDFRVYDYILNICSVMYIWNLRATHLKHDSLNIYQNKKMFYAVEVMEKTELQSQMIYEMSQTELVHVLFTYKV